MMNWISLQDLARERSRDMIDDAKHSGRHLARKQELPAAEAVFLYGRSAHVINARARAEARLRVASAGLDLS